MRYADLHTHTNRSFDSEADLFENCRAAEAAGLGTLAVTNHFDFDGILSGIYPAYLHHLDREEIERARAAFPSLTLLRGVEMGQPHAYPHLVKPLIEAHGYDYLLASVHNLENCPDFWFLNYADMSEGHCVQLLHRYFTELKAVARTPGIDTLAHLTYPLRYMRRAGKQIDILRFEGAMREVFHILIETGVALEVNTSGLRQGMGETMPSLTVAGLYYDCGGRLVAVGSDAHTSADIGRDVIETSDTLTKMGFSLLQPKLR